jgi:uncharacterized membrane protein
MITVTFYYRLKDPKCAEVEQLLNQIQAEIPHQLVRVDIDAETELTHYLTTAVPVVKAGPYTLQGEFTLERLRMTLGAAQDRMKHLEEQDDPIFKTRYQRARNFSRMDRLTDWLSHHYLALFNFFLFLYAGLPFLAPVLMKTGLPLPARVIYTIYSPLCHQMAFRSWFLFGEQPYYPRDLAGMNGVLSYEAVFLNGQNVSEASSDFIIGARNMIGDESVGYKVALCERDVALYGGMLIFGMVFALSGRKIRQIPWYIWLLLGLVPIGIDGISQLPSLVSGLPNWLPLRESTPLWRTMTGALFGVLTAWYLYPLIEETMQDTRALLASKKQVVSQTRTS